MRIAAGIALALVVLADCVPARADIGLMLDAKPNEHRGIATGNIIGEGHAGIYLSRVCAASPVRLRMCAPGEAGSVLQNYHYFREDQPYEWNVVPLTVYLYGVDSADERPLFGSPELRGILQARYRQQYLPEVCSSRRCVDNPNANWRDSVAAAFVREVYIFAVRTTPEQDEKFVREFNARANVNHYNGLTRNCADFAKQVLNLYFPHSAHRNLLNDFGVTGPKAVARSFVHYAERHPELELRVIRIEQVPGTYRRSSDCHEATEQAIRAKWLMPVVILEAHAVPVPLLEASYLLTGRFSPDRELRHRPSGDAAVLYDEMSAARQLGDQDRQRALQNQLEEEQERELGTERQWQSYRERFEEVLRTAITDGIVPDRQQLHNLFRGLQARGEVEVDQNQEAWLEVESDGQLRRVGLSGSNILGEESDPRLALQLLLARTAELLSARANHRELYSDFQAEWTLLDRARERMLAHGASPDIATRVSGQ
ncbi:MAG TPA: hypothetical protein VL240_01100 [Candidatus Binatia bacterium]|nr:hypothetical protein [Candidatus Binatia bacterium]